MNCQWQIGMLVMRECGAPAAGACAMCGRAICADHALMGPGGAACPQCASANSMYPQSHDTEIASSRGRYYSLLGGAAAFGAAGYFSQADSEALHRRSLQQRLKAEKYDDMET